MSTLFCFVGALLFWASLGCPKAHALVLVDAQHSAGIDQAIAYGLARQGQPHEAILEGNWLEQPSSYGNALLNVYSPFMQVATKVARYPKPLETVAQAKSTFKAFLRPFYDENIPQYVDFSVSFYGTSPNFAMACGAMLTSTTKGRPLRLQPDKTKRQLQAKPIGKHTDGTVLYEAINHYLFKAADVSPLRYYSLALTSLDKTASCSPVAFSLDNTRVQ